MGFTRARSQARELQGNKYHHRFRFFCHGLGTRNFRLPAWEKLRVDVRNRLRSAVLERLVRPYLDMMRGKRELDHWVTVTNNWNAVCHAGVVGAALIECKSPQERAEIVAGAEKYSSYFLSGFTPDGYCSEGLGYWNYGFGHFVYLSETVRHATGGKLEFLHSMPEALAPARFGTRIQITDGIAPAFADCPVGAKPSGAIMWLLSRRVELGTRDYDKLEPGSLTGFLPQALLCEMAMHEAPLAHRAGSTRTDDPLRTWFKNAGVLISRPSAASETKFGVAVKGGNNAEHHNHNDIGSYVVVNKGKPVLLDPGSETYTARTFSSRRYESKLLSSFGHAVPVVGGTLQRTGKQAQAKVILSKFDSDVDRLSLDITSAYNVPQLKKLVRAFEYRRGGIGKLTVQDAAQFDAPTTFGTALITLGKFKQVDANTLEVTDGKSTVHVAIDASNASFDISSEEIHEDAPVKPTRIGINLRDAATSASIKLGITPKQ